MDTEFYIGRISTGHGIIERFESDVFLPIGVKLEYRSSNDGMYDVYASCITEAGVNRISGLLQAFVCGIKLGVELRESNKNEHGEFI